MSLYLFRRKMKNPLWFIIWLILLIVSFFIAGFCAGWYIFVHPLTVCIPAVSVSSAIQVHSSERLGMNTNIESGAYMVLMNWFCCFRDWVMFSSRELNCPTIVPKRWLNAVHWYEVWRCQSILIIRHNDSVVRQSDSRIYVFSVQCNLNMYQLLLSTSTYLFNK